MGLISIIGLLLWGWAEMSAFIFIGNEIGGLLTLLGVFFTAIVGIGLLKNQGLSMLNRIHSDVTKGHPPVMSIADGVSSVVGGVLLFVPGYVTDAIGVLLFIPGFRTFVGMYLLRWVAKRPKYTGFANFGGVSFTKRNTQRSSAKSKLDPFGFGEQHRQRDDLNDVIEGKFEERQNAKPYLHKKKRSHHNDC